MKNRTELLEELRLTLWELCHKENTSQGDIEKIHELSTLRTKLIEDEL